MKAKKVEGEENEFNIEHFEFELTQQEILYS